MYIRPLPIIRTFLWEYSPRVKGINGLSRKDVGIFMSYMYAPLRRHHDMMPALIGVQSHVCATAKTVVFPTKHPYISLLRHSC